MIDSRVSDAVALALRFKCDIFIKASIFEEMASSTELTYALANKIRDLDSYSVAELEKLLQESLDTEDYDRAAQIRDELKNR